MKLLVTGREGQLARSLAEQAAGDCGFELVFAARPDCDLSVPGSTAARIAAERPDLVINAAAYTAVDLAEDEEDAAFRINADAAGEVAAAAAAIGAPIFQISTDYVFDGSSHAPIGEEQSVAPIGVYGRSKLAGEEQVRNANPHHLVLRTAWVISPFGRNFVRSILSATASRPELTVVADQQGSPTSALDLAAAILHASQLIGAGRDDLLGRTFHLVGSGEASWFELASAVMEEARTLGLPAAIVRPIRTADWPTSACRPAYSVLDSRCFAEATAFSMPHWRTSLPPIVARLRGSSAS